MAFLGGLVPDTPAFTILGFVRSGNLAQMGIVQGLRHAGVGVEIWSGRPVAAFPRGQLFCSRQAFDLGEGLRGVTIPAPNVLVLREICQGLYAFGALLRWAWRHRGQRRCILTYNLYTPPFPFILLAARLTKSKIVPILFDLGAPPDDVGRLRRCIYRVAERVAKWSVPRCDGRVVVTDALARDYAGGRHVLRVDGGITRELERRLFPLRPPDPAAPRFRLLCAGMLWPGNGIGLLLEAMRLIDDPTIELWFAGRGGESLKAIQERARTDTRIVYKGVLDHEALFKLYEQADLLLNIRMTKELKTDYVFPSKMLEYLAVGKPVLSTAVAHLEQEYGPFCFVLSDESPRALADMIAKIKAMPAAARHERGCRARAFMLKNRTWDAQALRIRQYLETCVWGERHGSV